MASKLVVFGATGKTGLSLIDQALAAGHEVAAFVRSPDALGARAAKIRVVVGDVFDAKSIAPAIRGCDAIYSALGTRPWRHVDICSQGTRAIAAAMAETGVKRLVVMSSQGVGDSRIGWYARPLAALALRKSFRDKGAMEADLAPSTLDWVVVRPGLLTNGKPRGTWRAAEGIAGGWICRDDVAAFMLQQLGSDEWVRKRPVIVW